MSAENLKSDGETPMKATDAPAGPDPAAASAAPADLVAQMVAAGEWPEPDLMEKIVQFGDAAVDPLLEILRTTPRGWPAEAPLVHAIGMLSILRPARAVPDLVAIVKRYSNETCELAADSLIEYGPDVFEPLMELLREPSFGGYARTHAIDALKYFVATDPERAARLSEQLRRLLADAIERGREQARKYQEWKDRRGTIDDEAHQAELKALAEESKRGGNPRDDDEYDFSVEAEISFLVSDLADLADPAAREMIGSAFAEELVDESIIDEKFVNDCYQRGGEKPRRLTNPERWPTDDWLADYRTRYQEHREFQDRHDSPESFRSSLAYTLVQNDLGAPAEAPRPKPPPVTAPVRNTNPKIGRNDPCWCGSGKKYKKCHLGKDRAV